MELELEHICPGFAALPELLASRSELKDDDAS
jgi:hypothetical protein